MRYLLLAVLGGHWFYRLSFWDFVGAIFVTMFLLAGLVGLLYRDRTRRPVGMPGDQV